MPNPFWVARATVITIIATILFALTSGYIYPETLEVVDYRFEPDCDERITVLSTASGVLYEYAGEYTAADDVEFLVGELFSAVMINPQMNDTIFDDDILWLEPSGFVTERFDPTPPPTRP